MCCDSCYIVYNTDSFTKIAGILKEVFGKVKEAENYAVFREFMYIKRKSDEDIFTYVSR